MRKISSTKGFTLVEVLVAMGLFAVVSTVAAGILVDVVQLQKKSTIQNEIFEDARILMQQITNSIQSGTIDYEEYYSMNVIQQGARTPTGGPYYGINYGVYASRFFDPGKSQYPNANIATNPTTNPENLGIECSYPKTSTGDCEIYFSDSTDLNTGQNPYKNRANFGANDANALCDKVVNTPSIIKDASGTIMPYCDQISKTVHELYLLDSSGTHKTILAQQNMNSGTCGTGANAADCAVGMVKMTGRDLDQNGVIDVFSCDSDYAHCIGANTTTDISAAFKYPFLVNMGTNLKTYLANNNIKIPQKSNLGFAYDPTSSQFIPITPRRANIKTLNFTINPLDDPYKAYAEPNMQTQPTVTISMTIGLASAYKNDYPGTFPDITVQETVTAGVVGKIDSYPPVNDVLRSSSDPRWIYKVFNP